MAKNVCLTNRAVVSALWLGLSTASAQAIENKDRAYYCGVEAVGGVVFNEGSHQWVGAMFNNSSQYGKFVLKMKFVRSYTKKEEYLDTDVSLFNVTYTLVGSNDALDCDYNYFFAHEEDSVPLTNGKYLRCSAALHEFKFNFATNRFISIYTSGYTDGKDNNDNTPSIAAGRCTRVD